MGSNNDTINLAELTAEDKANLVNALKDLAVEHSDVFEFLSPIVRKRVDVLRELQDEHDELEAKFFEERIALEDKYQKLYQPIYTKRYEIVNGIVDVEKDNTESDPTKQSDQDTEEKGVPEFWLGAMKNNEVLYEEISDRDEAALMHLKDIKWSRVDDPKGFKLEFYFDTNPFFKNSVLTKTYHVIDETEPILEKAIGTEIEWYPGKNLTEKILKKKPKKGSKNTKPITKTEECESFFNFFSPPQVPEDDDESVDEAAAEELQNAMEEDYDIGLIIRDQIIGHAVSWYTGEAVEVEDEYDVEVDDDEEDEDEDVEVEVEEDDSNEEESKTIKEKSETAPTGDAPQGETPPEGKQK